MVGDWVVDEYWFLVRHHSQLSSQTGAMQYRVFSQAGDPVKDLCGAGHIARILYSLRKRDQPKSDYELVGLGSWHKRDELLLKHLIHAEETGNCPARNATFTVLPQFCDRVPRDIDLIGLRAGDPTVRVIRQYHQEHGHWEQINRADWEQRASEDARHYSLRSLSLPAPDSVQMIAMYDLGKGAVTTPLVKALQSRYPSAKWCVRSKTEEPPEWLPLIASHLTLLMIGPEVAALLHPLPSWLSGGRITDQARALLMSYGGFTEHPHANLVSADTDLVLVTDLGEMIGRFNRSRDCFVGTSSLAQTPLTQVGWAAVFMAALIHNYYKNRGPVRSAHIREALDAADSMAGVPAPGSPIRSSPELRRREPSRTPWQRELAEWEQGTTGLGIIRSKVGSGSALHLDVWRGSSHLPGYIACVAPKRDIIRRIAHRVRQFSASSDPSGALAILLQADPGAGKSLLAKSLAAAFGLELLRCDITQMIHRVELLDFFDSVAAAQGRSRRPVLVFVDEINASLEGSTVYGAFLSPLEEGTYARWGKPFGLGPCAWIFAGTRLREEDHDRGEKLSDFESRMSMIERIDYASLNAIPSLGTENAARLEHVYLGAIMIRMRFPDVQYVSLAVLRHFYEMEPGHGAARRIRKLAGLLRDVQYGRVTQGNCRDWPSEEQDWNGETSGDALVQLLFDGSEHVSGMGSRAGTEEKDAPVMRTAPARGIGVEVV